MLPSPAAVVRSVTPTHRRIPPITTDVLPWPRRNRLVCDLPVESRRDVNDDGHGPPLQARASVAVPSFVLPPTRTLARTCTHSRRVTNPSSQALPVSGSARWEARCRSITAVGRLPACTRPSSTPPPPDGVGR